MKSIREQWSGSEYDFYLIFHEHLFVFRKPAEGEKMSDCRNSGVGVTRPHPDTWRAKA
jgi:hypothetical protein